MVYFDAIIGHDTNKKFLEKEILENRIPNSFIFYGPAGVGKHLLAIELAKVLNCESKVEKPCNKCFNCKAINENEHPDVIVIDPQANIKPRSPKEKNVDFRTIIMDIIKKSVYKPTVGKKKIIIFDDASFLSVPAMNNLLKIIEEPPDYMHIILITEFIDKILDTIKSRSQILQFNLLKKEEINSILKRSNIPINNLILDLSNGSVGYYFYLQKHFEMFNNLLHIIIQTVYKAKHIQEIIKSSETIVKELRSSKNLYFDLISFFNFFMDVFNFTIIKGNLIETFKEYYQTIFVLATKVKIQDDIQKRFEMASHLNKLIDDSIRSAQSFVNPELILIDFIRTLGAIFRGIF